MARASYTKMQRVAEGDVDGVHQQTRFAFSEVAVDVENEPARADVSEWAASTAYTAGDRAIALSSAHPTLWFVATTTGTSGGSQPTWPTVIGATVVDSGVTWRTENPISRAKWAHAWRWGNIGTSFVSYMSLILENATLSDDTAIGGTDDVPTVTWSDTDVKFQAAAVVNRVAELP